MPKVINVPRVAVQQLNSISSDWVWVSISEPQCDHTIVHNSAFNKIPQLKIAFWDITQSVSAINRDELLYPPTEWDAKAIVDFLLKHTEKNVIVNCAAGISRSGAIAQFCEECLGYEWEEQGKRRAMPNYLLFKMMRDYYISIKFDNRPLLSAYDIAQLKTVRQ